MHSKAIASVTGHQAPSTEPRCSPSELDDAQPGLLARTIGAVVIGGDYQGLGIVRSLGRHGIPVCVVDDEYSIARFSKFTTYSVSVASLRDEEVAVQTLLEVGHKLNLRDWVLYPTRDETVAALSRHRIRLSEFFRVPTPGWSAIRWACDKRNTYRLAENLGIPIPQVWSAKGADELRSLDLRFPVAVKPAVKERFFYATKVKAWRADNPQQLQSLFARATSLVGTEEVIIQELVPGDGRQQFAYCGLFKDGDSLASLVVRRTRQHPPEFGRASTFVETVELPELQEMSEKLLRAIGYYGLVEIEYKLDTRDKKYKLLDFNARTWGYHTIGYRAGVDFPYLLFADQMRIPVARQIGSPGVSWIRYATDVPTAMKNILAGRLDCAAYWRSVRDADVEAVFSPEDPMPSIAELALLPYLFVRRGL